MKFKPLTFILLILVLIVNLTNCQKRQFQNWKDLINYHLRTYPESEPQDIYKLVYQGVLGPYHLQSTKEKMRHYLETEFNQITASDSISLVEIISPDQKYIRINLQKYKAQKGNIDKLINILYQSCQPSDFKGLVSVLAQIDNWSKTGEINLNHQAWSDYYKKIKKNNYFTPHHSEIYIKTYSPAYRVVSKKIWEE